VTDLPLPSGRVFTMPGLPVAASKVLQLLQQPRVDAVRIARAAESDPAWSAELLRTATSPVWSLNGAVDDVAELLGRTGFRRFTQLVAASAVGPLLRVALPGYGLAEGELWDHSLAVALATREILLERGLKPCEEAFTAALLHDVGKLVLGSALESERAEGAEPCELLVEDAEIRAVGMSHTEAGAILLEHWHLPYWMVAAVGSHHAPESAFLISELIHVADALCLSAGLGAGRDGLRIRVSADVSQRWNFSRRSIERIVERTLDARAEAAVPAIAGQGR
jgi:putative nucleotidyltransferase with HDIG domain